MARLDHRFAEWKAKLTRGRSVLLVMTLAVAAPAACQPGVVFDNGAGAPGSDSGGSRTRSSGGKGMDNGGDPNADGGSGTGTGGETSNGGDGSESGGSGSEAGGAHSGGQHSGTGGEVIVDIGIDGKPGMAMVSGGVRMSSPSRTLILTLGESPGGTAIMSSPNHSLRVGVVAATENQKP